MSVKAQIFMKTFYLDVSRSRTHENSTWRQDCGNLNWWNVNSRKNWNCQIWFPPNSWIYWAEQRKCNFRALKAGKEKKELGNHALQMMFLRLTGFRFPFAHFISRNINATQLYILFWEAVNNLKDMDFSVQYVCIDGAVSNRSFMHLYFPDSEPLAHNMKEMCPAETNEEMIFMTDPSHT